MAETRVVRGRAIQHNVTETGIVDQPRDLTRARFQTHGLAASLGTRDVGTGASDGTFAVPVATGAARWALELDLDEHLFLVGDTLAPDLSVYHFGRGDARPALAPTAVGLDLSGVRAWQATDSLQIVAPNVGLTLASPESGLATAPAAGATAISGAALDWKNAFVPLVDAGRGDTTWVTQLVSTGTGRERYRSLAQAGIARGFTLRDGQAATLGATLAPVAQDRGLTLHWHGSAFAALAAQAGPGARPAAAAAVSVSALPTALAEHNDFFANYYQGLPALVELGPFSGTGDHSLSVRYGNPFATKTSAWTEFVTVVYAGTVPVPTPHGIGSVSAMMVAAQPVAALADGGELVPAIAPVRHVAVDGRALDVPRAGVGATPTLTWDAPALGTATSYAVGIHAVTAGADGVSVQKIATLYTAATSLQVPASVLAPTGSYVLTITAIAAPGTDLSARPRIGTLPYASADYVTALITP